MLFDYSKNTGGAEFFGMQLREGKWEYEERSSAGQTVYSENSTSKYYETYAYDKDKRLTSKTLWDETGKRATAGYAYNQNGSLVRETDYSGMVSETVFDQKGNAVRTVKYHRDEPGSRFYNESKRDEKGKVTGEVNAFGESVAEYEYSDASGNITSVKQPNGGSLAYGYDSADNLTELSASDSGEKNANAMKYTLGLLTSCRHNGTEYGFTYDGFGRTTGITIGGTDYVNSVHTDGYTTAAYASGESYRTDYDKDGKPTEIVYLDGKGNSKTVQKNIYDTFGNLTCVRDTEGQEEVSYNTHLDKFGRTVKRSHVREGKEISAAFEYDKAGKVQSDTVTVGAEIRTTTYGYESGLEERLTSLTLPNGCGQKLSYDRQGRVKTVSTGYCLKEYNYLQMGDRASELLASGCKPTWKRARRFTRDT